MTVAAVKDAMSNKDGVFRTLAKAVLVLLVAVFTVTALTGVAFADDDDKSDNDFSFYKVSSAATAFYDDAHNPSSDTKFDDKVKYSDVTVDKAGMFVGFIDENYDSGLIGSTVSFLSSSSMSRSYDSFSEQGIKDYVLYGHALASMGLDGTANDKFNIAGIVRYIGGGLLFVFYTLSLVADLIFSIAIGILQTFNPFSWLKASLTQDGGVFTKWFGDTPDTPAIFDGITQFISGWADTAADMGMFLAFFLFFVSLAGCLLLWNSKRNQMGSTFRMLFTRVLFICVGLPLLGGLYTSALDLAAESSWGKDFTPAANQIVASTIVDFEGWAEGSHLALPKNVKIAIDTTDSSAGVIDAGSSTSVRSIARAINADNSSITGSSYDNDWTMSMKNDSNAGSQNRILGAYDLMGRYMSSAFYHASDFETAYKAGLSSSKKKDIYNNIKDKSGKYDQYQGDTNFIDNANAGDYPYFNDGSKSSLNTQWSGKVLTLSGSTISGGSAGKDNTNRYGGTGGEGMGLSSMSMYNYLTTSFSDSSVVTYSTHKASSDLVTQSHYSADLIGDGASSVMYWLNAVSMLFAISVIGIIYALGIIINMIGRGIKMISSVPFALMGNFKAMAKCVTIVAMMIIEVLGTFFVYSLVIEILISLSSVVETPIYEAMSKNIGSTLLFNGTIMFGTPALAFNPTNALVLVGTLLSSVMYLWFTFKAIKLRKSIIKTIDEAVAGMVDRIFTVNGQTGSMGNAQGVGSGIAGRPTLGERAKGAAKQAAGGVVGGMGMAAGQQIAGGAIDAIKNGVTAGDAAEVGSPNGEAENPGGTEKSPDDGSSIEGFDKQGLPTSPVDGGGAASLAGGADGLKQIAAGGSASSIEDVGKSLVESDADSLGDIPAAGDVRGLAPDVSSGPEGADGAPTDGTDGANGLDATTADSAAARDVAVDEQATADAAKAMQNTKSGDVDKKQLAADGELDSMMGNTSALEEDADAKAAHKLRGQAAVDGVKGVAQTVKGGVEAFAAVKTGDAQQAVNAAKDLSEGAKKTAKAGSNAANATDNARAARAQANQQRQRQTGSRAAQPAKAAQAQSQRQNGTQPQRQDVGSMPSSLSQNNSRVSVTGGKTTQVSNSGPTNINVGQRNAMSARDQQHMAQLQQQRRQLEQARAQVQRTGQARLPNGRIVNNVADVQAELRRNGTAQRQLTSGASRAAGAAGAAHGGSSGISGAAGSSAAASTGGVAKKALDVKKVPTELL